MAVGFFAPEDDERPNGVYHVGHVHTTSSATQTPLQSPVSREYLVQAFCEALHRCSIAGEFYFNIFLLLRLIFFLSQPRICEIVIDSVEKCDYISD